MSSFEFSHQNLIRHINTSPEPNPHNNANQIPQLDNFWLQIIEYQQPTVDASASFTTRRCFKHQVTKTWNSKIHTTLF